MAARIRRTTLNDAWREKIKQSQIVNRIQSIAFGEVEATPVQIKALEILAKRFMPELKSIDMNAKVDGHVTLQITSDDENI